MNDWDLSEAEFRTKRARQARWALPAAVGLLILPPAVAGIVWHSLVVWWLSFMVVAGLFFVGLFPLSVRMAYREASGKRRPDPPMREPSPRLVRTQARALKFFKVNLYVQVVVGLVLAVGLLLSFL